MTSKTIKILIVEDSITMRNLLFQAFSTEPQFEIVSYASNGKLALPRIKFYKPDFVILDYEMPLMDGLETLREIKNLNLDTKVIMFSAHTIEGAEITIKALEEGAVDFVPKPDIRHSQNLIEYIKENLIYKLKQFYNLKPSSIGETKITKSLEFSQRFKEFKKTDIEIAGIGISSGGPMVLHDIFKKLKSIIKPLLIVQHMPPLFTTKFAETLNRISNIKVVEAKDRMMIENKTIYVAPGGYHMIVEMISSKPTIRIIDTPPKNNCKPSVDYLFESLAYTYGRKAMGIIMTGMGSDGYDGIKLMYERGCYTIAQSPETCTVYGMPKKPIEENLVYEILTPDEIANRLNEYLS